MKRLIDTIKVIISVILIATGAGVAFIALPIFGNQALIVRSGSMLPTIDVGSIIVIRPLDSLISPISATPKYEKGDIIAFRSEKNSNTIITHRVTSYEIFNGTVFYKTKGDANEEIDNWQVDEKNIIGKSFLTIPEAGKILAFAKSKYGFPLLIILPSLIVILMESLNIVKEIRKNRPQREAVIGISPSSYFFTFSSKALKVAVPIIALGFIIPTTLAFLKDTETSSGNVLQAAAVFPTSTQPTPTGIIPTVGDTQENSHVVISEVQIDGGNGADNDNDFIELYNPTSSPLSLNGFRLVKRTGGSGSDDNIYTFTALHNIPAYGYFLWGHQSGGNNPNTYATTIGADVFSSDTLGASNSIAIRQGALDTGSLIDALSWDPGASTLKEGTEYATNPQENQSLERKALSTSTSVTMSSGGIDEFKGNGFDENDNNTDFILRTLSQPQKSSDPSEMP